jgi:RNA-binding protein
MPLMPPSDLRRALRGHGHAMSPIVQVGKAGVTDALVKQVNQALADHELIKVKIGAECPADRHEVADRLDREPGVDIVQIVGRVLLVYKRHPQAPRYEGKRAQAAGKTPAAGKRQAAGKTKAAAKKRR